MFFLTETGCALVSPILWCFQIVFCLALEASFKCENRKCSSLLPALHVLGLCSALTVSIDGRKTKILSPL